MSSLPSGWRYVVQLILAEQTQIMVDALWLVSAEVERTDFGDQTVLLIRLIPYCGDGWR